MFSCAQTSHSTRCAQIEILAAGERRTLRVRCVNRRLSAHLTRVYTFSPPLGSLSSSSLPAAVAVDVDVALECSCRCHVHARFICMSLCETEPNRTEPEAILLSVKSASVFAAHVVLTTRSTGNQSTLPHVCVQTRARRRRTAVRTVRATRRRGRACATRASRAPPVRSQCSSRCTRVRYTQYAHLHVHILRSPNTKHRIRYTSII